ncbi:Peptidase family M48 [Ekhidna lutea]|uniref:Peptidase family M48 n=1 Tax=Ekhidna lutea TaxID=447679 RepID=A0A239LEI4_EKHLU|nr:M48 family metallopeptidase [Ekhidna lutea]SNT29047.1 Peptidase family M48 [Ekhidna lutea]
MKIWRELLILVLVFGLIWLAFTWRPLSLPDSDFNLSSEREEDLAELILDDIKNQYEFYDDSITNMLLSPITSRLLDSLNPKKYEYRFHLIDSSGEINAFATIDGHIYVFSGLLKFVDNPEQLAGILAHEIGHHENGDLVDRLMKELGLSVLLAVMTGGDAVMVSEISKILISTGFDRKQEREADEFAYNLMIKSQINPARLAHFFTKLKAEEKSYPDNMEIIASHPNSKNRIEGALSHPLPKAFEEREFEIEWKKLIEEIL